MIPHFYKNIQGWFNSGQRRFYEHQVIHGTDNSHFVEVGAWKGRSTSYMGVEILNSEKNIKFDVVDTWLGSDEEIHKNDLSVINNTLYEDFLKNIEPVKSVINLIRSTSIEASQLYEDNSLDFVFIDASHKYQDVKDDIKNWLPKVRKGGILAGDDICWLEFQQGLKYWNGVERAVEELLPEYQTACEFFGDKHKHIWIHKKSGTENLYQTDIPIDKELLSTPKIITNDIVAVIPAYNDQEGLEITLQSLDRFGLAMIVAVDDGSEPPLEAPYDISTPFELIRHDKNRGAGTARNTGVSATKSDWVYFTDCSCIHQPDIFKSYSRARAAADSNVSAVVGPVVATTQGRLGRFYTEQGILNPSRWGATYYNEDNILEVSRIITCNALVSRTALDEVGHFDEKTYGTNFGEDTDLGIRLWHVGRILWCEYAEIAHDFTESLDVFDLRFKRYGKAWRLVSDKYGLDYKLGFDWYGPVLEDFKDLSERRFEMELKGFKDV